MSLKRRMKTVKELNRNRYRKPEIHYDLLEITLISSSSFFSIPQRKANVRKLESLQKLLNLAAVFLNYQLFFL